MNRESLYFDLTGLMDLTDQTHLTDSFIVTLYIYFGTFCTDHSFWDLLI